MILDRCPPDDTVLLMVGIDTRSRGWTINPTMFIPTRCRLSQLDTDELNDVMDIRSLVPIRSSHNWGHSFCNG